jgi:WD40 repeat protein
VLVCGHNWNSKIMRVATGDITTGTINIWDIDSGNLVATFPNSACVFCFSRDGSMLAATTDHGVYVLDVASSERVKIDSLSVVDTCVCSLCFSVSADILIAASVGEVAVIDMHSKEIMFTLSTLHSTTIALYSSVDNKSIVGGLDDGRIIIWDSLNGNVIGGTLAHPGHSVTFLRENMTGTLCASASADRAIVLWDTTTWEDLITCTVPFGIRSMRFKDDNTLWYISSGRHVFGLSTACNEKMFTCGDDVASDEEYEELEWDADLSPDGSVVLLGGLWGLRAYDASTGEFIKVLHTDSTDYVECGFPSYVVLL